MIQTEETIQNNNQYQNEMKIELRNNYVLYGNIKNSINLKQQLRNSDSAHSLVGSSGLQTLRQTLVERNNSCSKLTTVNPATQSFQRPETIN